MSLDTNTLIGMTKTDAYQAIRDAGMLARVVQEEHIVYHVTQDYRLDRVNLTIAANKVTRAHIG